MAEPPLFNSYNLQYDQNKAKHVKVVLAAESTSSLSSEEYTVEIEVCGFELIKNLFSKQIIKAPQ